VIKNIKTTLLCALSVVALSPDASAASQKDLQILGRALGFIEIGPSGDVKIGIVYANGNAASATEADEIMTTIGGGLKSGKITLQAEKVSAASAAGSAYPVLYFTEGTEAKQASIFSAASSKGTITVSTHGACLSASNCVMVIKSKPKVDIQVSTAGAGATGVSFGSAFRMMITER
jgi:hypothetical protein